MNICCRLVSGKKVFLLRYFLIDFCRLHIFFKISFFQKYKIKLCPRPAPPTYWLYIDRAICKLIDPTTYTHTHTGQGIWMRFAWVCIGILGQVWYWIVSIPDLCTLITLYTEEWKLLSSQIIQRRHPISVADLNCLGATCYGREKKCSTPKTI